MVSVSVMTNTGAAGTMQLLLVLCFSVCTYRCSSSDVRSNLLQALNMLKHKQQKSVYFERSSRSSSDHHHLFKSTSSTFERSSRSSADLRDHRLFHSDLMLDCCPTVTELAERTVGINPQGLVLELFHHHNFTQTFYETLCHPGVKDLPCQFMDPRFGDLSRCVQQYSYVYAMGRTFGKWNEQYRIDYIRIAAGCKCTFLVNPIKAHHDYITNKID